MIALLVAVLSGAMFYLSQGFDNAWALAWFAPVPLLWLAYGKTPIWQVMAASAVAVLASVGYLLQFPYTPPLFILVPVLVLYVAQFCIAVWFARVVWNRATPLATLFAFPACWTTFEFLSELAAPNGTNGSWAYSQMSAPVLIQSASLFGMYAVTFLLCLFANTLAMALRPRRQVAVAIGVGVIICMANALFGFVRLAEPRPTAIRVAGVVDETAVDNSWRSHTLSDDAKVTETYAGEIRQAALEGAKFVVTPEGGMASIPEDQNAIVAPLVAVSMQTGVQIIAGFHTDKPPADFALAITPDGAVQRYDKRHPVPGLEDRFTPGHASGWLGNGRAMQICFDMDIPSTVRPDAAKGVRMMGVPAGDFGIDRWLHSRQAVMRGVENGFALVRAAHDGLVIASDAQGRLVASKKDAPTGLTMIVADLPLGPGPTLYTRIGNAFAWLCVAAAFALGTLSMLGRRKRYSDIPGASVRNPRTAAKTLA
jgi:apolipoprotein N-acyltransferase